MKCIRMGALLAGLVVLVAGCRSEAYTKKSIVARASALRVAPEYTIGEGDSISIQVIGHGEYQAEGTVRSDGKLSFPEHGDIECVGKTPEGLRQELEQAFQKTLGLRKPKVFVSVRGFASKGVIILGEVERPGRFAYTGQMRITDLLGVAIGANTRAAPNRALLFREVDGAMKIYQVHLKDFFEKADFSTNFYIRPGDIIYIPKNGFAMTADNIRKVLEPLQAFFEIFGLGGGTVRIISTGTA